LFFERLRVPALVYPETDRGLQGPGHRWQSRRTLRPVRVAKTTSSSVSRQVGGSRPATKCLTVVVITFAGSFGKGRSEHW